jgi:hypothetical protein
MKPGEASREVQLAGPASIALSHVRIIASRIGAVRLAIIVSPCQTGPPQPPAVESVVPAVVPVAAAPIAETIVRFGDGTVVHIGDGTVRNVVKAAAVKPTRVNCAAVEPATMEPATVEPATVEPATTVESSTTVAPPSAMRVGEVWLAERSNAQHSSCGASQSPSYPGLGAIFG